MWTKIADYVHYWYWRTFFVLFPEWTESWKSWPHCCGQAGCWAHLTSSRRSCCCKCHWCRPARKLDKMFNRKIPLNREETDQYEQDRLTDRCSGSQGS